RMHGEDPTKWIQRAEERIKEYKRLGKEAKAYLAEIEKDLSNANAGSLKNTESNTSNNEIATTATQSRNDGKVSGSMKDKIVVISDKVADLWVKSLGLKSLNDEYIPKIPQEVQDKIDKPIKVKKGSLLKIIQNKRTQYIKEIKPTFEKPDAVLKDADGLLFIREIGDELYFVNVNVDKGDYFVSISQAPKTAKNIKNKLKDGAEVLYRRSTSSKSNSPSHNVQTFTDFPSSANSNGDTSTVSVSEKGSESNPTKRIQQLETQLKQLAALWDKYAHRQDISNEERQALEEEIIAITNKAAELATKDKYPKVKVPYVLGLNGDFDGKFKIIKSEKQSITKRRLAVRHIAQYQFDIRHQKLIEEHLNVQQLIDDIFTALQQGKINHQSDLIAQVQNAIKSGDYALNKETGSLKDNDTATKDNKKPAIRWKIVEKYGRDSNNEWHHHNVREYQDWQLIGDGKHESFVSVVKLDGSKYGEIVKNFPTLAQAKEFVEQQVSGSLKQQKSFNPATVKPATDEQVKNAVATPKRQANNPEQAKEQANAFLRQELINKHSGLPASVSNSNLNKMISNSAYVKSVNREIHSLAVANVDELYQNAIYGWSKPDRANSPDIAGIHRLFATLRTEQGDFVVKMTVKEYTQPEQNNALYTVEALEVETQENSPAYNSVKQLLEHDKIGGNYSTNTTGAIESLIKNAQEVNAKIKEYQSSLEIKGTENSLDYKHRLAETVSN
ncbi:MAG: hypothetical protein IJR44_01225, partial [Neisseriaceae bacterium]|nr:hypothetical protein [Neisseriaceae bacterium]